MKYNNYLVNYKVRQAPSNVVNRMVYTIIVEGETCQIGRFNQYVLQIGCKLKVIPLKILYLTWAKKYFVESELIVNFAEVWRFKTYGICCLSFL